MIRRITTLTQRYQGEEMISSDADYGLEIPYKEGRRLTNLAYETNRREILEFVEEVDLSSLFGFQIPENWFGCDPSVFEQNVIPLKITHAPGNHILVKCKENPKLDMPDWLLRDNDRVCLEFSSGDMISRGNNLPAGISLHKLKACTELKLEWFLSDVLHRTTGPAMVTVRKSKEAVPNPVSLFLMYDVEGQRKHRDEFARWYEMVYCEEYKGL